MRLTGMMMTIFVATLAVSPAARADNHATPTQVPLDLILGTAAVELGLLAGGLVAAGVNSSYATRDVPAPLAWKITGYTMGGLNAAAGIGLLAVSDGREPLVALGIGQLVLAALDIGTTIYTERIPEPGSHIQHVSASPLILADTDGQPAFGVGLRVTGW
jgi:hypothetical protein